jgi:hypothetical protein
MTLHHGPNSGPSRRRFLGACVAVVGVTAGTPKMAWATMRRFAPHPAPRPGITAAKVLTKEQLTRFPGAIDAFDGVREIPQVVDGIRCRCGCADLPGYYSLLSCYEGDAMATICPICQGEGRLAVRLHKAGKTLDEIRAAIDAKYD